MFRISPNGLAVCSVNIPAAEVWRFQDMEVVGGVGITCQIASGVNFIITLHEYKNLAKSKVKL
jgi:hypothetical protein